MDSQETLPRVYRELADFYERRAEPSMRDRFLVLAMDADVRDGRPDEAEKLRRHLLQLNPHHMLRPFGTFAEAVETADVQTYLRDLRMNYPSEVAQVLLRSLRANNKRVASEAAPAAAAASNGAGAESLKVYSVQQKETKPSPPEPAHAETAQRRPAADKPSRPTKPAEKNARGGWFGVILFVVVLLCAIALLGYVLGRPFLPAVVNPAKQGEKGKG
jgi:hypothetical protein